MEKPKGPCGPEEQREVSEGGSSRGDDQSPEGSGVPICGEKVRWAVQFGGGLAVTTQ